jgi:hypothetical protein
LVGDLPNGIEPIVSIETYSFYIFLGIVGAILLMLSFAIFYFYRFFKKEENSREINIKILQTLDLKKSKESAYLITKIGREIAKSDRELRIYFELISLLEKYKYRKEVSSFSDEVIHKFNIFLEVVKSE